MKPYSVVFSCLLAACAGEPPPATPPAAAPAKVVSVDCGPALPGFEKLAAAPLVVLGEVHGQVGPPAFAANLACREATAAHGATLALEILESEQPSIDAFLASDGGAAAKSALLASEHWSRQIQDGRSSTAMFGLLEKVRGWTHDGLPLRVVAIDADVDTPDAREPQMAKRLVALVNQRRGPVVMLVGNYHARTSIGAPWDPKFEFMATIAKRDVPNLLSLDERYDDGTDWVCITGNPDECGRKRAKGPGSGPPGSIDVFSAVDKSGYSGTYSVGPAIAANPAIGVTPAQEASALVYEFRVANRPKIVDGAPGPSPLAPEARSEWCSKFLPIAEKRVPQTGDRWESKDACSAQLIPAPARQAVPDVKVAFDVGFFFKKPFAAASYDREAKTLYLPLASVYQPWNEVGATRHEWLHARHHAKAMRGDDPLAIALMTFIQGPDYRPDQFDVDEVPVNLCDLVREPSAMPSPPQLEMTERYIGYLRKELDALKSVKKWTRAQRAHIDSSRYETSWVGGKDPKKSLALLENVWKDATTALAALKSMPPNVEAARKVPLLANGMCSAE